MKKDDEGGTIRSMTSKARLAIAGSAVVLLVGLLAVRHVLSEARDERIRVEMQAKAQAFKEEIDRRFAIGTARATFVEFAERQPGWHASAGADYYISIGQEPSRVWYCGPWDVGVIARFRNDRLVGTEISSWGFNCP
jgi:hypothetical protein